MSRKRFASDDMVRFSERPKSLIALFPAGVAQRGGFVDNANVSAVGEAERFHLFCVRQCLPFQIVDALAATPSVNLTTPIGRKGQAFHPQTRHPSARTSSSS